MPEHRRVVVANTTPTIDLALIGQLNLLGQLYGEVLIPPAVEDEILRGGTSGIAVTESREAAFVQTTRLSDPSRADLLSDLDRGETEVIALSQEVNADLVVIDGRLARQHAKRLGLKLTGTLGILLEAKREGHVVAVKPLIEQLVQRGIRLGDAVVAEALGLAGEGDAPAS